MSITQVEAKAKFLTHCRATLDAGKRTYVRDKSSQNYMVLDSKARHMKSPAVKISAQYFKDNFSRFSALVRFGVCFELTLKGEDATVYVRRPKDYTDPVDDIFERWLDLVIEEGLSERGPAEILRAIQRLDQKSAEDRDEINDRFKALTKGLMRMALGHRPFEEGTSVPLTIKSETDRPSPSA